MAVLQMWSFIFLFTQCYAREPSCKQFEYEEKMLNKMIRTEITVEGMVKRLEAMEEKLDEKVKSFTDAMKTSFDEMLKASLIDGEWTEWSAWNECASSCGVGIQSRYRSCDNPARNLIGQNCDGSPLDYKSCVNSPCQDIQNDNGNLIVAFTAYHPLTYENGALTFEEVYTNYGDSFNKDTGKFVCKVPGLYYFSTTLLGNSRASSQRYCNIYVGLKQTTYAIAQSKEFGDYPSASANLVHRLNKDDEVYLGNCGSSKYLHSYTHFSGFLIR